MQTGVRRIQRIIEHAARNFYRKCKRRGIQVWWVNNCGEEGRIVWALRAPFSRGLGILGPDLDQERTTFWIPRQYQDGGELLFPVTMPDGSEDVGLTSRIWYAGKLYEVDLVSGDVEGMPETAVFRCDCVRRFYNPFVGDWSPPSTDGTNIMIWTKIGASQEAQNNNGYLIDAGAVPVVLSLPAAPSANWQIGVRALNLTHPVTISGQGGLKIEGRDDLEIDIINAGFTLVYSQDSLGWCVVTEV